MKRLIPIFVFLLFLVNTSVAQTEQISIKNVILPDDATWNFISAITQDSRGYMWFSTHQGIYKYDGGNFVAYTAYGNDPNNPESLVTNVIETMCSDRAGNIWIGTTSLGISMLDPVTGIFTHYRNMPGDSTSLGDNSVFSLMEDRDGYLWVGTGKGVDRFDKRSRKFSHFSFNAKYSNSLTKGEVRALYEDKQGTIWVGCGSNFLIGSKEGGLNRFNKTTGTFTRYMHNDNDQSSLADNRVRSIFEDSKGNFWIGTPGADGLHIMDRKTGTFKRFPYDPANPSKLSRTPIKKFTGWDDHVSFIREDAAGIIWIGTFNGMNRYNPKTGITTYYSPEKDNPLNVLENIFWCSYTSRDGVLWIGDVSTGLFKIDVLHSNIPYYYFGVNVNSVYEESPGVFWVGTEAKGLILDDHNKGTQKKFIHDNNKKTSISNDIVWAIRKDTGQKIWVGTAGGLNLLNPETQEFTTYKRDPDNKNSLNSDSICYLYTDHKQNLWVGTQNGGLNLLDRKTGTFIHYPHSNTDTSSLAASYVSSICEDNKNRLLVGNWEGGGLNVLNQQNGHFSHYLKGIDITYLYKDHRGVVWVGTSNVLYQFDVDAGKIIPFIIPQTGKKINDALSMLEDDQRNLWICTKKGFIRLDSSRNIATSYGAIYGVKGNTFVYGDGMKGPGGNIIFCDQLGYYSFYPDQINSNPNPPQLVLTEFLLQNQLVKPGKGSVLETSLMDTKEIRLNYKQNFFSFEFNAIDYSSGGNDFLFMLENYDKDWRKANATDLSASYFNVLPGEYVFHVKVINSDGLSAERSVSIIIYPPWWRTWWAYTLFGILFVTAVAGFIYYRSGQLRRENRLLEEKVTHRTAQLNQSLEHLKATQTQLIQSEKMASLGELTAGIAHEIQNPLNFVNNFSEVNTELIDEAAQQIEKGNINDAKTILQDIKTNEEKINHHGKRADSIVKGMLQHSRSSSGVKEPTAINALAEEYLRLAYQGLRAKDKSFNVAIQTDFDTTLDKLNIIPQDIGRVLLNLYNNAFYAVNEKKNTSPGSASNTYEPIVSVGTKKMNDTIEIKIKDNGNGIPQNIIDKIFQPFFTTKPTGQGTGLGLSLSYDIIKVHGGEIKVRSDAGEGTEFIVQLPAG